MSYYDTPEFEEEMIEEGNDAYQAERQQERADEIRQGLKEDGVPEALMYKTRTELETEKELVYSELIKTMDISQLDKLIRYKELEIELIKRLGN